MKIAVIGATGLVGNTMLKVLEERHFPFSDLLLGASTKSAGSIISYKNKSITVQTIQDVLNQKPQIALFSAGSGPSLEWAQKFADIGCFVVDNSSAWRMKPEIPLVVPEINADVITKDTRIIANPNCSTIQMVMVLNPLHKKYQIKRVVVSTYQSVSGSGMKAVDQLMGERNQTEHNKVYPHIIDNNILPHIDSFLETGYTKEEMKMVFETQKIMRDATIKVSPTAVRVPVSACHSESVNIEFEKPFELTDIYNILEQTEGVILYDKTDENIYPMPIVAAGKDEVYVGRIRRDETISNGLNAWIVADNIRKGAATNAVQIAEYIYKNLLN
ncbi:MAG: aspartate-semialdehyde dehydrogenase [Bacteroidetes bacterium]|nr:aspartate-semialdehyde dehydrogenase [Bacteroidota bacterium]